MSAHDIDLYLWSCIGKKGRRKKLRYYYERMMNSNNKGERNEQT